MLKRLPKAYTFDDVLLIPQYSEIDTRSSISLESDFLGVHFQLPIISANMDYVTGADMAIAMWNAGGLGILHRFFDSLSLRIKEIDTVSNARTVVSPPLAFSIGLTDFSELLERYYPPHHNTFITIDVAHGDHKRVIHLISVIKEAYPKYKIIAGNVATRLGFYRLAQAGADAIKVGIGPGSVCTTRLVTGVGIPQLSAIMDIADSAEKALFDDVKIIADGGIRNSGDIVKALAAGADMVMLGSLLAGTDETPAPVLAGSDGRKYKAYRGQSIFGSNGTTYVPEGVAGYVPVKGPVAGILRELEAGIRSGMSYVGAKNLHELQAKANFVEVTPNSMLESNPRVLQSIGG